MSAPHRQLYRVLFSKELAVPACRSGVVSGYRLLYRGVPYVLTGKLLEKMMETDPDAASTPLPDRPVTADTQRLLVFFPGGIGDVVSLKPVLQQFRKLRPEVSVAVISTVADQCLIGDVVSLFDYPIPEVVANHYDAWINIAEMDRASVGQELMDTFSEYLGVPVPAEPPSVQIDAQVASALSEYIVDRKRPVVGVHMDSACHFRSIPHVLGAFTMMALVERGCDCYVLGGPENGIAFTQNGVASAPPDHIYDMTKFLGPLEHYMAFLKQVDVLLTCDTGAMHLAGALSVPTLAVFGMTDGEKRTGYYPSVRYVQGEKYCSPCERIAEAVPCDQKSCTAIAEMQPEMLAEKVIEVLRENVQIDDE